MNLSNLTSSSLYGSLTGKIAQGIPKILVNAPVSSYTKPLDTLRQTLLSRQDAADALVLGFTSVSELYDAAADVAITYKGERPPSSFSFEISEESLNMLASAIKQCGVRNATSLDHEDWELFISSATNQQYCVRLRHLYDDDIYILQWLGNEGQIGDFVSYRQKLDGTLAPFMRFWAQSMNPSDDVNPESVLEVATSLLYSNEINVAIAETCGTLIRGNFESFIKAIDFQSKTAPVRKFFNQLISAYHHGGLKGAVYYIFSYIKGISTLTNENGVLEFTDNNQLRPSEYIAGFVSIAFAAIGTVIATIVAIFQPVIGLILTTIGSIVWGLIGNFKFDYDSTKASILTEDTFNDVAILDAMPFASMQLTIGSTNLPEYQDYYNRGDTVLSFDVPGGQLFVGPGAFEDDGNTVSWIRVEFHPIVPPFGFSGKAMALMLQYVKTRELGVITDRMLDLKAVFDNEGGQDAWLEIWSYLTTWPTYPPSSAILNDDTTKDGVLSNATDAEVRRCAMYSLFIFIMNILFHTDDIIDDLENEAEYYLSHHDSSGSIPAIENKFKIILGACSVPDSIVTDANVPTWKDIVDGYSYPNQSNTWKTFDSYGLNTAPKIQYLGIRSAGEFFPIIMNDKLYYSRPYSVPGQFRYGLNVPKYNSATFFGWIAAAVLTVSVITAATVFATIKVARFIKQKRASNIAKYFGAQSKFQSAQQGVMQVTDPQTGEIIEVSYDMNSTEGKAYLADCYKQYRKTAFHNNLWAKLIGGTRFDTTTFYGEADMSVSDQNLNESANFADLYSYVDQDPNLNSSDGQTNAVLDLVKIVKASITG